MRRWTDAEIELLMELSPTHKNIEMVDIFDRSVHSIESMKKRLGLRMATRKGDRSGNFKDFDRNRWKRAYRKAHPEQRKVMKAVREAKDAGTLVQGVCAVCKSDKTVAHHEDYSKPLEVVWLCRKHHRHVHLGLINLDDI